MSVKVGFVQKGSKAYKAGINAGDLLIRINGHTINDVLDYRFYTIDTKLEIEILRNDKIKRVKIKKSEYDELGLDFDTYLMDKQRSCKNKCVFCFIDQLPPNMRESLYFKDDDSRLSFLFGNYITLTNLTDEDVQRIIDMHISPVNVSVHTMNPELRCKMMNNRFAGESLDYLKRLAKADIKLNCQLVLCPGINGGDELIYSLQELSKLYPSVQSVAAVPVGLTKYRDNLHKLTPFDKETSNNVIDIINSFGDEFVKNNGERVFYAADEFYLKAGLEIPSSEFYEEFPQIENGVGLWSSLRDEFCDALENIDESDKIRTISIATGESAAILIDFLVEKLKQKWHNLECNVYPIKNNFFGEMINVAGLVTGNDLVEQLKDKNLGELLLIPKVMLRAEDDLFLDDVSLEDVQNKLGIKIQPVSNDGNELLFSIIGEEEEY